MTCITKRESPPPEPPEEVAAEEWVEAVDALLARVLPGGDDDGWVKVRRDRLDELEDLLQGARAWSSYLRSRGGLL